MKLSFRILFIVGCSISHMLFACTGIRLTSDKELSLSGRTVEFGTSIEMYVAVIPRNYSFIGKAANGSGLPYQSKYAAVGIYCFKDQVLMDGINEKGLVAAAFYFPGYAEYSTKNPSKALSPVEFPNWILTQFATIDEVRAALSSVEIAPTIIESWGPDPAPFHYIVYDKEGRALVIEPIDGKLITYENKIGNFTNSPSFDWHITNLNNFISLSPINAEPKVMRGQKLKPFGQGSGLVGLPGDFTPPSRFIRSAIFSSSAVAVADSDELVNQAFHILNQFDIPKGSTRSGPGEASEVDYTMITTVKDPNSLKYYFKSYEDQEIKWVALSEFDLNTKAIRSMSTKGDITTIDVSSGLK